MGKRIKAKFCKYCGVRTNGDSTCHNCHVDRRGQYYKMSVAQLRQERKKKGICTRCGNKRIYKEASTVLCQECLTEARVAVNRTQELKKKRLKELKAKRLPELQNELASVFNKVVENVQQLDVKHKIAKTIFEAEKLLGTLDKKNKSKKKGRADEAKN